MVLLGATGEQADLQAKLDDRNGGGKVASIDYETYAERQEGLNARFYLGDALLGVGAACLGASVWLLATAPSTAKGAGVPSAAKVMVVPQPGGARALVAWRF